jgi:MarR family 2-MHQ and catechol resistance regulon transcriptional repressor
MTATVTQTPARPGLPIVDANDPRLDADALKLHRALSDLVRVYQFRDRDRICCYDVSVSQCYALEAVIQKGPLSLNALAAELYLEKSTASRVVDGLQKKGYVERRDNPEDRRALLLEATPAGRELYAKIDADLLEEERKLLSGFSPEVRESMAELISQLARAAASRIDTSGGSCCMMP